MKKTTLIAVAALLVAAFAGSQEQPTLNFTPISCMRAGEMAVLQPQVTGSNGELRAFFRRVNTTDWCSVEGKNQGLLSSVTLPKFDAGDEIEYFFMVTEGKRVLGRSPQIYRVKITERCETMIARNAILLTIDCSRTGSNSMATSLGAGYALKNSQVVGKPPYASPDSPE